MIPDFVKRFATASEGAGKFVLRIARSARSSYSGFPEDAASTYTNNFNFGAEGKIGVVCDIEHSCLRNLKNLFKYILQ